MSDNLLIVFGGTKQSKFQEVFTPTKLKELSTDVLQFNLLTVESNVMFYRLKDDKCLELVEAETTSSDDQHLTYKVNKNLDIHSSQDIRHEIEEVGKAIEEVNWSHYTYSDNSDGKGMTQDACHLFSSTSKALILSFLKKIGQNYKKIFIMAHSRGCSLAIDILRNSQTSNFNIDDNVLTDKLKRIVLLDPVAKNVGFSESIIKENVKVINKLSHDPRNIEIHFVAKTEDSQWLFFDTNYKSFVDRLVGTQSGEKVSNEHRLSGDNPDIPDMRNIYLHLAHMTHEGMLEKKLRENFRKYQTIISGDDWTEMYSNDKSINISELKTSEALKKYIEGKESANNINPENGDPIYDLFHTFPKEVLDDRRRAFIHCLASKVYSLQCKTIDKNFASL